MPQLASARTELAACFFDGRIVAVGGRSNYDDRELKSVEHWSPGDTEWHRFPDHLSTGRADHAVVVAASQLYAIGGFDGSQALASVEVYNLATKKWTAAPPLNCARRGLAAVAINERLFAVGGSDGHNALDSVECLDLSTGVAAWRTVVTLGLPLHALCAVPYHGDLVSLGGESRGLVRSAALQHTINAGQWRPLGNGEMQTPRRGAAAAVANGSDIYVCGGHNGNQALATIERWTPSQQGWLYLPELSTPRSGCALVALPLESSYYTILEHAAQNV